MREGMNDRRVRLNVGEGRKGRKRKGREEKRRKGKGRDGNGGEVCFLVLGGMDAPVRC